MVNLYRKALTGARLLVNNFDNPEYLSWAVKHRNKLRKFQDRHLGEKCFIIGNGPSLNRMDLSQIQGRYTFGLNKIYLHPQFNEMEITYHVAVNPLVIEQSIDSFKQMGCTTFLSYGPCYSNKLIDNQFFYLFTRGPHRFSFGIGEPISEGCTVTYVALQLAYFMGFSEVYLIGVDHRFQTQGKPHEKQVMEGADENHFHPDYFSGKEWHLPDLAGSELSYQLAKYYFERSGRRIFDATVDGKLNVFPKIDFKEALDRCKPH